MRVWPSLLISSLLAGQEPGAAPKPAPLLPAPALRLSGAFRTPQETLRAMITAFQAASNQPGATVEVIGYDDEAALQFLSLQVADRIRLAYNPIDKHGHQELYSFMHQDPKYPGPVLSVPMPAGASLARAEDKWLR